MELQDTYSVFALRLINGLSYRYDQARSASFLNGRQRKDIIRAFSQFEWYASEHWLRKVAACLSTTVVMAILSRHALRSTISSLQPMVFGAVYSEAVRSPDMFENHADWRYRVKDLRPAIAQNSNADFFISAQKVMAISLKKKLEPMSLAKMVTLQYQNFSFDIKVFDEKITADD